MFISKAFFKDTAYGWDGLSTFIFSNILLFLSFGLGLLWLFIKVCILARKAPIMPDGNVNTKTVWLVAGLCLRNNLPVEEFKVRLDRVVKLMSCGYEAEKILILGGISADNQVSEAKAGAEYLHRQGVPESLLVLEDQSRHTLENLQHARTLLEFMGRTHNSTLIISSRYHLCRILTLAQGLGLRLTPVAAENQLSLDVRTCLLIFKEAYFLHWYWSGRLWVFITGNRRSRARIT